MIVKAVLALIKLLSDVIFAILPDIPVLPSFIGESLNFMSNIMISGAGIVKYMIGDVVYGLFLDYIVVLYGFKIFKVIFDIIKKYVFMK